MFDKLEDLLIRYEEIMSELNEPDVVNDQSRYRRLMKEQSDLTPIIEAYREYKDEKKNIEESLQLLDEESDEEMRELAKEELAQSKARVAQLEHRLKVCCCCPRIPTTTRTSSWRYGQGQAETRRPFSRRRSTGCTRNLPTPATGRRR